MPHSTQTNVLTRIIKISVIIVWRNVKFQVELKLVKEIMKENLNNKLFDVALKQLIKKRKLVEFTYAIESHFKID